MVDVGMKPEMRSLDDWRDATSSVDPALPPEHYAEEVLARLGVPQIDIRGDLNGTEFSSSLRAAVVAGLAKSHAQNS